MGNKKSWQERQDKRKIVRSKGEASKGERQMVTTGKMQIIFSA